MSLARLIYRSWQFYWRSHLGVLLGTLLAAAILTGSLVVGNSVRFSLWQMAAARLGKTTLTLTAGDRFFRADLARDLEAKLAVPVAPVLLLRGAVTVSDGTRRANEVQVVCVDARFDNFSPTPVSVANRSTNNIASDEVGLSEALARRLQVQIGATVVVRLEPPGAVSRDLPLSGRSDDSLALRLRVRSIAGEAQFGRFSLQGNQAPALSVFLPLAALQQQIQQAGRANVLLLGAAPSGTAVSEAQANAALAAVWTTADADLELRTLPGSGPLELRTPRVFLDPVIAAAARAADPKAIGVLTYFVNEIRRGDRATPYSFIAAAPPGNGAPALADDEIAINQWLADDLGAQPGDELTLRYFVLGERRQLREATARFRVRMITPLAADPSWMPDFPGLADTENCRDWKPGIPLDLDRIRSQDEAYWNQYRGTPKAFVTLAAGQRLWGNRFGQLTAMRFATGGETGRRTAGEVGRALLQKISPAALGFTFTDVQGRARQASATSQDFGQLFLGFSFFLIVAALLLTALLFAFNLEQRNAQVGLLRALGFSDRKVRLILLLEGAGVAVLGTLLGLPAGLAFTQLTLRALATVWRGAVGAGDFFYHAELTSLLTGAGLSLFAAFGAMALTQRGQTRRALAALLASGAEVESGGAPARGWRANLGWGIGVIGLFSAVALVLTADSGKGAEMAETFFCAGLLALIAGLGFTHQWLVWMNRTARQARSLAAVGWRNASRRRARSLTTVSVLAVGVFMVVAVSAFHQNPRATAAARHSGTGGFALYGQAALPIYEDLNTVAGRAGFNLPAETLRDVSVVPLRVRAGDDASCLNLNRALQPRLLAVSPAELQRRQAFAFSQALGEKSGGGGAWDLLNLPTTNDVVPAVGDEQTVRWALGKALGDTLDYTDDRGRAFKVQIVGILTSSILQGGLLISEPNFIQRFPSIAGYRAFLVDAPPERADAVAELLTRQLQDKGLAMQPAWQRLADFMAVENTYLGIFQALGGLGLLLGSLGLGIVVLRNVLERRNELALLQAVGFRPTQLQRLVLSEHWLLVVLGLVIGLGAALLAIYPAFSSVAAAAPSATVGLTLLALAVGGVFWCWLATRLALHGPLLDALRKE